jgi:hypothetical protein
MTTTRFCGHLGDVMRLPDDSPLAVLPMSANGGIFAIAELDKEAFDVPQMAPGDAASLSGQTDRNISGAPVESPNLAVESPKLAYETRHSTCQEVIIQSTPVKSMNATHTKYSSVVYWDEILCQKSADA